jgi:glycosyltransferase involved in cell wall biosynthesis
MPASPGKVLIIVENLPVPFDRRVWMESTTLAAAGYAVSVICPMGKGYEKPFEVIDGIHIYRHPLPPEVSSSAGYLREYGAALWHEWRLARKVKKERGFDAIHACNPPDLIFLVALWFKILHGTKFLFDQHDLNPELYESKFERRDFFYQALRFAERFTFAAADLVISTNESYRAIALSRGRKKPERVFVVRSGPRLDLFNPVPPAPRHKRGKPYLVGYLGVMGEFDGVDHLVRAAHELILNRGRSDIGFCFVGSGPMLDSLKAMAVSLQIDQTLEFTGRVSDREMIERISSCDVCVDCDPLNPLNNLSTMNKVLEYMALKRPIVQYDLIEGRRSALEASVYARPNDIHDLADKIEGLLANPEQCRAMGEFGRRRMENELEWKHQSPKLLAAYEALLGSRAAGDE